MRECCENCKHRYHLEKFDYSNIGCVHTRMEGYICTIFMHKGIANPPIAVWMVGTDANNGRCECFEAKEE